MKKQIEFVGQNSWNYMGYMKGEPMTSEELRGKIQKIINDAYWIGVESDKRAWDSGLESSNAILSLLETAITEAEKKTVVYADHHFCGDECIDIAIETYKSNLLALVRVKV